MAEKIKSTPRAKRKAVSKPIMIRTGPGAYASPEAAKDILDKQRRDRATREHNEEGHGDKLKYSGMQKYLTGNPIKKVKHESDAKKKEHIDKKVADSKRSKKYENQK
jgi:hypothetical protein